MLRGRLEESSKTASHSSESRASTDRVVSTKELLGGAHRIWIEHQATRYLLQVTRSDKLILTK
jgi:hemin uptake protein HemP